MIALTVGAPMLWISGPIWRKGRGRGRGRARRVFYAFSFFFFLKNKKKSFYWFLSPTACAGLLTYNRRRLQGGRKVPDRPADGGTCRACPADHSAARWDPIHGREAQKR